jgi:hypothetical protein
MACFYEYPNVHGVSIKTWLDWLNESYEAPRIRSMNALFMHFFASSEEFSIGCAKEIIKSAFKAAPECHYIMICLPLNTILDPSLSSMFSQLPKRSNQTRLSTCSVLVANREKHVPVLHIRNAK